MLFKIYTGVRKSRCPVGVRIKKLKSAGDVEAHELQLHSASLHLVKHSLMIT